MEVLRENEWVILTLPDNSQKIVQLKTIGEVDIGRFGKFQTKQLIGVKSGKYFEVEPDGKIKDFTPPTISSSPIDEIVATNQTLLDTNMSQRLSTEDIEALKAQVTAGELNAAQVVDSVVQNSETFANKNVFSQMKYVQRKQRKFLRWFMVRSTTVRTLCNYFLSKDPRKIMDLRLDSVSQIICRSNVQMRGSRCLIWDETNGFLTGVMMAKMSESSLLVNVHPDRQMQAQAVMYFNFDDSVKSRLLSLPIDLLDQPPSNEIFTVFPDSAPDRSAMQQQRFEERQARKRQTYELIANSRFDSLVIATACRDPLELLGTMIKAIRPSSNIIVYSTWREILLPAYVSLRRDNGYVDVFLTESWLRPYQASPGRIHPQMNCNGHTGSILSATRITRTSHQ